MNKHPCQDKCPHFLDEQCCHCLVQEQAEDQASKNEDEAKFLEQALIAGSYVT